MWADALGQIIEVYLDIELWFKKKKRRKFEKVNGLLKKR